MTTDTRNLLPWTDPQFRKDPYPWYERLQREQPVYRLDDGSVVLLGYHDVVKCARDSAMSTIPGWNAAGPWKIISDTVSGRDLPEHTSLRRQTNHWFTPKLITEWLTTTAREVNEALDQIGSDGSVDGWMDMCVRPTHATMARILGVPKGGEERIAEAMADVMPMLSVGATEDDVRRATDAWAFLAAQIDHMLNELGASPTGGMANALLDASASGDITVAEARATTLLFFGVGHMDVGYIAASGFHRFARTPGLFETFKQHPESRLAIIDEIVRLDPAELAFVRHPKVDVEFSGITVPAGTEVRCLIGAANRDPGVFADPQSFNHERPLGELKHISFGAGIHQCAGQMITRREVQTIFEAVASRYDRIELAEEPEVAHHDFARAYRTLPLRFS